MPCAYLSESITSWNSRLCFKDCASDGYLTNSYFPAMFLKLLPVLLKSCVSMLGLEILLYTESLVEYDSDPCESCFSM